MSGTLSIRNRQRAIPVDVRRLRRVTLVLLRDLLAKETFELGICLVRQPEMTRLNETFLGHNGPTDVITFDYSDAGYEELGRADLRAGLDAPQRVPAGFMAGELARKEPRGLHGEIVICVQEAVSQARRFRTSWQRELARYVIHGLLHLEGYDDRRGADRRKMKREEGRLLRRLGRRCPIAPLARRLPSVRNSSIGNRGS